MDIPSWFIDIVKQTVSILLAVSPLLVPQVRDFVAKSVQLSFDKALENKKTLNERKNYISKHRFDVEFQIYRELSQKFLKMKKYMSSLHTGYMIPPGDNEEIRKFTTLIYNKAFDVAEEAQNVLYANASFIPGAFFEAYEKIHQLYCEQLKLFSNRWQSISYYSEEEKSVFMKEHHQYTERIEVRIRELNNQIREYLSSLDTLY